MNVEETLAVAAALTPAERVLLFREVFKGGEGLSDKERAFIAEYLVDFNEPRARRRAGFGNGFGSLLKRPQVAAAVEMQMAMRDAVSELKADYVKQYMLDVLELCPLDFLEIDEDGDFVCDLDTFKAAPRKLQRLVENFEVKWVGRRKRLKVTFVSKAATLAMAAKYTLVQKFAGAAAALPWDQVAGMLASGRTIDSVEDELMKRIEAMPDAEPVGDAEGSVQSGGSAVA